MSIGPITVSEITKHIQAMFESDEICVSVSVLGEVSNYKKYPSGHHYFTLKDPNSVLSCVMFKSDAASLSFTPANGISVVARGRISVYPRDGKYQLYCKKLTPEGAGSLSLLYEKLFKELDQEGLFDPRHKKPLPEFPKRVALVTSPVGSVVSDMLRILGKRWPLCEIIICPVHVQGEEAPSEIAEAIREINRRNAADIIISGRGGGSLEDLWAYNDPKLARTIFQSAIPVISAVGHEPDVTISDYVADVRASTPSNAAEIAVPDCSEWLARLSDVKKRLSLKNFFSQKHQHIDNLTERLSAAIRRKLEVKREALSAAAARLDALSPLKVLSRGYSVAVAQSGDTLRRISDVDIDEKFNLRLQDGWLIDCAGKDIRKF